MEIIVKGFNNSSGTFGSMCTCDCACNCDVAGGGIDKIRDQIECARKGKFDWGSTCKRYTPRG